MVNLNTESWLLFVHANIDDQIYPQAKHLVLDFFEKFHPKKWPKATKFQGILQRAQAIQSHAQAFQKKPDKEDDSFQCFIQERILLEARRRDWASKTLYQLVCRCIVGDLPQASRKLTHQLLLAVQANPEFSAKWRKQIQVLLAKAWVQHLCYRALMHLDTHPRRSQ